MSETILKLDYPVQLASGELLSELKIRRAKAKDIRVLQGKTEAEQGFFLLSKLTGLVPEDLDELDIADFTRASQAVEAMIKGK